MDPNNNDFIHTTEEPKVSFGAHVIDFIQTLVVFAAISTAVYLFLAQPHKVSGASMFPNFHDGDYIITDKINYRFSEPKRGDIVVFKNPRDKSQDFIKRVIGVPGDRVSVSNGVVYLNSIELKEPYIKDDIETNPGAFMEDGEVITVEPEHLLVMGDNRPRSSDSREWGQIEKSEIIGRVFLRYWPQNAVGLFPAAYEIKTTRS